MEQIVPRRGELSARTDRSVIRFYFANFDSIEVLFPTFERWAHAHPSSNSTDQNTKWPYEGKAGYEKAFTNPGPFVFFSTSVTCSAGYDGVSDL